MTAVLDQTVALVTGASSGIGAATAAALSAQGATVALAARRKDRLDTLAASIRDSGGTALVLESDITDEQQAAGAVARTVAELGRLDTLVNNAGVMLLGPAVGAPLSEWQQMIELNACSVSCTAPTPRSPTCSAPPRTAPAAWPTWSTSARWPAAWHAAAAASTT